MTTRLPIQVDSATSKLLALARGAQAAEMLPKESAKTLAGLATAARKFAEAWEYGLALLVVDDLDAFAKDAEPETPQLASSIANRATALRKALAA